MREKVNKRMNNKQQKIAASERVAVESTATVAAEAAARVANGVAQRRVSAGEAAAEVLWWPG